MLPRLLLAAFLLGHAAIHASFLTPRPPATATGPAWPFELGRSWILTPLGLQPDLTRVVGMALVALTVLGFAIAAIAVLGLVPGGFWPPAAAVGASAVARGAGVAAAGGEPQPASRSAIEAISERIRDSLPVPAHPTVTAWHVE